MTYFISYDISDPKRLRNVAKTLENFGFRLQYSFFQCDMEKDRLEQLKSQLLGIIDESEDSLRIYPVCEDCLRKNDSLGDGAVFVAQSYQIL